MIVQGKVHWFASERKNVVFFWLIVMLSTVLKVSAQLVEAGEVVEVNVEANAFDSRTDDEKGCAPDGCTAENTRDGDLQEDSRWSCSLEDVEDAGGTYGDPCRIVYYFSDPLDVNSISIAFKDGDTRKRTINVEVNGDHHALETSGGITAGLETFELNVGGVESIGLESVGLDDDEVDYLSIIEVTFDVSETPAPETPAPETPVSETPAPETPAPETPAPETPASETPAPEPPSTSDPISGGTPEPVQDPASDSCDVGSMCPDDDCCHPDLKTCGRRYDYCQERDPSYGAQCCAGLDGDPDERNTCTTDIICEEPEGDTDSLIQKTEVWLSILGSALGISALVAGCCYKNFRNSG